MCGGCWHPNISDCFITGSVDGTIRIWDVPSRLSASVLMTGPKSQLSALSWLPDGSGIISGSTSGNIQLWANSRKQAVISLPQTTLITSISVSKDKKLAVRSIDGFLRLWDIRKFSSKDTLASISNLPTAFEETDVVYSPDENVLVTGTSDVRGGSGYLKAFDANTLEPKGECIIIIIFYLGITESGVVRIAWNSDLLVFGLSSGCINIFSDTLSIRSTSSIIKNTLPSSDFISSSDLTYVDIDINAGVYAPETQNLIDEDFIDLGPIPTRKRPDPIATKRPELPPDSGPGRGGKIGTSVSQHILRHLVQNKSRGK